MKSVASNSDNWHQRFPMGEHIPIEKKHLKLDVFDPEGMKHPFLAGLAMGLLFQIHDATGSELFIPEIYSCGISIKDKHRLDNTHTDYDKWINGKRCPYVKILGILNSDWEEEWGGGFIHNGTNYYIKPTSFCIFDGSEPHSAAEIFTDNKRFAIDFIVKKNKI